MPSWYGHTYPTWRDLEQVAEGLGAVVVENGTPKAAFIRDPAMGGPMILIPHGLPALERMWNLAHELGHLVQHEGPRPRARGKQESQADRWAACALIPQARIDHHGNACEDAFIGALSRHYQDLSQEENTEDRRQAAKIARIRLAALTSS